MTEGWGAYDDEEEELSADEEYEAWVLAGEIAQAEQIYGERFDDDQLDYVIPLLRDDEHVAEGIARLLPGRDWADQDVRREQLEAEVYLDREEREADQEAADAELPEEVEDEVDEDEAAELSDYRAETLAERRHFERVRRPLIDDEAVEFAERQLEHRAAGNPTYSWFDAEQDSYVGPAPATTPTADLIKDEMQKAGQWGDQEEANWNDRHPNE